MPQRSPITFGGPPINISLFDLAPRGVCLAAPVARRAGELLPHRFTHHPDWSRLVCSLLHLSFPKNRNPGVTRLAALWCSDFPPRYIGAIARSASLHGVKH